MSTARIDTATRELVKARSEFQKVSAVFGAAKEAAQKAEQEYSAALAEHLAELSPKEPETAAGDSPKS